MLGQCGSGHGDLMTNNCKTFPFKKIRFLKIKIAIHVSLGLHIGQLGYRRRLQHSKDK
jgi:hypothetical protein